MALHLEHRSRHITEAAPVEGERDVDPRNSPLEGSVRCLHIGRPVSIGHIARVVARNRRRDFGVADRRQSKLLEDSLDGTGGSVANAGQLLFAHRLDPTVDLPVALNRQPLVDVVGVVVAAAERVVVARHHRVAGGDEIRSRQELAHQLRRLPDRRMRGDRIVPGRDFQIKPCRNHVLGQDRARTSRE